MPNMTIEKGNCMISETIDAVSGKSGGLRASSGCLPIVF
jgi:hypothetical protein